MIGDLLVKVGLISSFDLTESITVSKRLHMPIGRVLIMNGTITQENLQSALEAQSMIRDGVITVDIAVEALQMTNAENIPLEESLKKLDKSPQFSSTTNRLGELLLEANLVSNYQLEDALKISFETQMPLGATLVSQGYLAPSLLPTVLRTQEQIREGLVTREAAIRELRSALVIWEKAEESLKQMTYAHESRKGGMPDGMSAPAQVTSSPISTPGPSAPNSIDTTWHGSSGPAFQRSSQASAPIPAPAPPEPGSGQYSQHPPVQEPGPGSGQYTQYPPPYPPAYPPYGYPPPGPMDSSWHGQQRPYPPHDPGLQSGPYGQLSQPPYYPPGPPPGPIPDPSVNSGQYPQQPPPQPYLPYGPPPPGMGESWQGQRSYPPGYYPPPQDQLPHSGQYSTYGQPLQDPRYQSGQHGQLPQDPQQSLQPPYQPFQQLAQPPQQAPQQQPQAQQLQVQQQPRQEQPQEQQLTQQQPHQTAQQQSQQPPQQPQQQAVQSMPQQARQLDAQTEPPPSLPPATASPAPHGLGLQMPSIPSGLGKVPGVSAVKSADSPSPSVCDPLPAAPQPVQIPSMSASSIPLFATPPSAVPEGETGATEPVSHQEEVEQHMGETAAAPIKQLKWKSISFEEEENAEAEMKPEPVSQATTKPSLKWKSISFEDEEQGSELPGKTDYTQSPQGAAAPTTAHWAAPHTDARTLPQSQEEVVLDRLTAKRVRKDTKKLETITPQQARDVLNKDRQSSTGEERSSEEQARPRGPRDTIFDATPPHGAAAKAKPATDETSGGKNKPASTHTKIKAQAKAAGASQTKLPKASHTKLQKTAPAEAQTKLQKSTASRTQKLTSAPQTKLDKAAKKDADQTLVLHPVETDVSVLDLLLRCDFFSHADIQAAVMRVLGDAAISADLLLVLNLVNDKTLEAVTRCQALIKSGQISADDGRTALTDMKEGKCTFDEAIDILKSRQSKKRK